MGKKNRKYRNKQQIYEKRSTAETGQTILFLKRRVRELNKLIRQAKELNERLKNGKS